ncbi:uncharacterized protein LOC119991629 isoform X2 [Tripterygium wilfordii]|uniref:uncharacterized protein LOC119991629 isoform X2 n=1 Tax=Tripterygium wilfordii TaxID=458696 RepID=UPI0018F83276|nr:uncharacterized protein LOC119991629 isoform X2 [Tripterygium wilfordii]
MISLASLQFLDLPREWQIMPKRSPRTRPNPINDEFKPASIDKTKPGSLNKNKDNRVSLEFQNSQAGKSNVAFEGCSEDYKENDAVLFFDGETFRLERLHRAVNRLRRLRVPGESAPAGESRLSPAGKSSKSVNTGRSTIPPVPVEVERIDIGEPEIPGANGAGKGVAESLSDQPNVSAASPGPKNDATEDHQDIDIEDLFGAALPVEGNRDEQNVDVGFDMNARHNNDTDDEIADVDDSGDEADKGRNAAEALRAQMEAVEREKQTSTSTGSSGSSSGSGSSSSDSEGSDGDSINSI